MRNYIYIYRRIERHIIKRAVSDLILNLVDSIDIGLLTRLIDQAFVILRILSP